MVDRRGTARRVRGVAATMGTASRRSRENGQIFPVSGKGAFKPTGATGLSRSCAARRRQWHEVLDACAYIMRHAGREIRPPSATLQRARPSPPSSTSRPGRAAALLIPPDRSAARDGPRGEDVAGGDRPRLCAREPDGRAERGRVRMTACPPPAGPPARQRPEAVELVVTSLAKSALPASPSMPRWARFSAGAPLWSGGQS